MLPTRKDGTHYKRGRAARSGGLQVLTADGGRGQPAKGADFLLTAAGAGDRAREEYDRDRKNKHKRSAHVVAAPQQDRDGGADRQDNDRRIPPSP